MRRQRQQLQRLLVAVENQPQPHLEAAKQQQPHPEVKLLRHHPEAVKQLLQHPKPLLPQQLQHQNRHPPP
jgi:hypothetical protein